jgi:hypothetical protein
MPSAGPGAAAAAAATTPRWLQGQLQALITWQPVSYSLLALA